MPRADRLLAASAAIAALLSGPSARAFCRTTTVPVPADFDPVAGCWTEGNVLYWANACVGYSLQRDASKSVSLDAAAQGLATAFAKWTGTACPTGGSGGSRVSIDVRDLGPVQCDQVQYNQDQPNQHVIIFRDAHWPHSDANNTLALTTVTFDPQTGEIFDADMEINSHDQALTVTGQVPANGYDFESIVTHETGHFLGMAHSGDSRATMFAHYQPGSTAMRNLTSDDVTGICSVYPPNGTRTTTSGKAVAEAACDPTPRHGFSTQCAQATSKGCIPSSSSIGAAPPDSGSALATLAALAGTLAVRRGVARSRSTRRRLSN